MKRKVILATIVAIGLFCFLFPEPRVIPVAGATPKDWHPDSFWYEPWGSSGVHKGIDIFAPKDTPVLAATHLMVLYKGQFGKGGKVLVALGPKLRIHYYAHLDTTNPDAGIFIPCGERIGTVGNTGNAAGKPPHLHYAIVSLAPVVWRIDASTQGHKKAFYLNPTAYLASAR